MAAPELVLEIENGDNAPLTVQSATGLVPVPRLTFKAGRASTACSSATPRPTRRRTSSTRCVSDVLDYSAVPVPATWLDATAPDRRAVATRADVLREPPATVLLWARSAWPSSCCWC